ncbi:MAG: M61 family metallopeptidase [Alcaligenaceae bacterium]|jgi:predicted metalloprotease with PDZ domain|nr:M61 family metallopeptidase [Alcaligenaceae bacterium]
MNNKMLDDKVFYSITSNDLSGHRFNVSLVITDPDPKGQILSLPRWIPGSYMIRDFSKHIETLHATHNKYPLTITHLDNHTWQIEPVNGGPIQIDYTVYAWDLSVRKAHLDESHGFFNGTSVFLKVHGQEHQPCLVEIKAPRQSKKWRVYTSLPPAQGHPKAAQHTRFGFYRAKNYDDLIDHPVEMGRPKVISFVVGGIAHDMVFTGVLPNIDLERIAADVTKICEAQIRLFEPESKKPPFTDHGNRYVFLTTVTGSDYGGLEHRNSTALICSRKSLPTLGQSEQTKEYRDFLGLVSHEYFHSWNVKRIKPVAFAPYRLDKETPTSLLWIFEGFTSYYDDLMLLRSGLITEQQYFDIVAQTINRVNNDSGRIKQSLAESSFDAWTKFYQQDENARNQIVSYYSKGSLIALCLDLFIRQESNGERSLDDVMRYLWQNYGKNFYLGEERGLREEDVPEVLQKATNIKIELLIDFLERYVYGTKKPPLKTLLEAEGLKLTTTNKNAQTVSLDIQTTKRNEQCVIQSVMQHGVAHKAGLSAGDVIVAIDYLRVDADNLKEVLSRYQQKQLAIVHVFRRDELRFFTVEFDTPLFSEYKIKVTKKRRKLAKKD